MQNGISPLIGETGRAIQASIAHLPPDQQNQYLTSAAQNGLVPFPVALALQAALKFKEPPAQAPAPGNVVGDMVQKLSGQPAAPQMPMPQQPQVDPRMAAGIATLSAPNMQGAQNMAGGGIVSFDEGGGVSEKRFSDWLFRTEDPYIPYPRRRSDGSRIEPEPPIPASTTRREASRERTDGGLPSILSMSPEYAQMLADSAPGPEVDEAAERAKSLKEIEDAGIGKAAEAYAEKMKNYTAEDIKNISKEGKQAMAAAYFDAAASGDPTFLGSIARGLGGAARAKSGTSKELRTAQREAEKSQYELDAAREQLKLQGTDRAQAAVDRAEAKRDKRLDRYQTLLSQREDMQSRYAASVYKANAKAATGMDKLGGVIGPDLYEANQIYKNALLTGDQKLIEAAQANLMEVTERTGSISAAWQGLPQKEELVIKKEFTKALADERKRTNSPLQRAEQKIAQYSNRTDLEPEQEATLKQAYEDRAKAIEGIRREILQSYGGGVGISTGSGGGNYAVTPEIESLTQFYTGGGR